MKGKKSFVFSPDKNEYTISLKKTFYWWYLIPLLLIILLLKINQYIDYKVVDSETKNPLENVVISINYDSLSLQKNTDKNGKTSFLIKKTPLYKILLHKNQINKKILTYAELKGYCPFANKNTLSFLTRHLNIIELKKLSPIHITIIDSISRKALKGIKTTLKTSDTTITSVSDTNGNVNFQLPHLADKSELIIYTQNQNYGDVRKYYTIHLPQTIKDTIALLSIKDGGLKGMRGDITVNLKWNTTDDLDLMLVDPCNNRIYYKHRKDFCNNSTAYLDIDANANKDSLTTNPQENIFCNNPSSGCYKIFVYYYKKRNKGKIPFKITIMTKNKQKTIDSAVFKEKSFLFIDSVRIR